MLVRAALLDLVPALQTHTSVQALINSTEDRCSGSVPFYYSHKEVANIIDKLDYFQLAALYVTI